MGTLPLQRDRLNSVQNISTITLLYELPWKPLNTRVLTGVSLPFLYVSTTATVEVRGPKRKKSARIQEDDFGFSDMVITPAILGWSAGNFHWSTGLSVYAPTGQYSPNDLAPLGKNFWTFEPFLAATYLNAKYGQEASLQIAFDANTVNPATDYHSGCQLNIEWLLAQHLPHGFSVGLTGFLYQQVTARQRQRCIGARGHVRRRPIDRIHLEGQALGFWPMALRIRRRQPLQRQRGLAGCLVDVLTPLSIAT
jgi:hypothetical protein